MKLTALQTLTDSARAAGRREMAQAISKRLDAELQRNIATKVGDWPANLDFATAKTYLTHARQLSRRMGDLNLDTGEIDAQKKSSKKN